jgi:hypothetical protein
MIFRTQVETLGLRRVKHELGTQSFTFVRCS